MLVVEGLTKRFGSVVALDDVSFTVEPGQIVGFLGPNGAGKTTTMRAIMRLVTLDGGAVTWQGRAVDAEVRQRFGYMPAERGMYPRMRIADHLTYFGRLSGAGPDDAAKAASAWLDRLGLTERAGDTVQDLSSGNQQRVQLALALLGQPDLLVLDEPFSGLDPLAVQTLGSVLDDEVGRGAALLLSSHQLDLVAEVCSTVVIVDRGRVVLAGDVGELRAASPVRYVDVEFAAATEWQPRGVDPTTTDGRHHRIVLDRGTDATKLVAAAHAAGDVLAYSVAPPDLSEVFLDAVGRDQLDTGDADTGDGGRP